MATPKESTPSQSYEVSFYTGNIPYQEDRFILSSVDSDTTSNPLHRENLIYQMLDLENAEIRMPTAEFMRIISPELNKTAFFKASNQVAHNYANSKRIPSSGYVEILNNHIHDIAKLLTAIQITPVVDISEVKKELESIFNHTLLSGNRFGAIQMLEEYHNKYIDEVLSTAPYSQIFTGYLQSGDIKKYPTKKEQQARALKLTKFRLGKLVDSIWKEHQFQDRIGQDKGGDFAVYWMK